MAFGTLSVSSTARGRPPRSAHLPSSPTSQVNVSSALVLCLMLACHVEVKLRWGGSETSRCSRLSRLDGREERVMANAG